jgi:hypothetical protein
MTRCWTRAVATLIALAALVLAPAAPGRAAESIRVGFLAPLTGIFAQAGQDYPLVSQFWTDRPAEFLKLAPYGRDYRSSR